MVQAPGKTWSYRTAALKLADPAAPPPVSCWRNQSYTRNYCSRDGYVEGPLCQHGGDLIRTDHWSCCGVGTQAAPCPKVCGAVYPGTALLHGGACACKACAVVP
jgi:hypothetical protein